MADFLRPASNLLNLKTLAGIVLVVSIYPDRSLTNPRIRYISKPLVISTNKTTPPRKAFEEVLRLTGESADESTSKTAAKRAPASDTVSQNLNQALASAPKLPVATMFYRRVHVPEMLISRFEVQEIRAQEERDKARLKFESQKNFVPVMSLAEQQTNLPQAHMETQAEQEWLASLSPRQRRILEASGLSDVELSPTENPQSLQEALAEKVDQELATMVRPPEEIQPAWDPLINPSLPVVPGNYRVAGHIYLDDKTPLLPNHHIEVHWMREGVAKKTQVIGNTQSAFQMDVNELVGQVRAEMYNDTTGSVVAAAQLRLSPGLSADNLKNTQLKLQPTRSVVARYSDFYRQSSKLMNVSDKKSTAQPMGQLLAKASFDENTEFRADDKGALYIDGISPNSSAFSFTESKTYYPALHVISTGQGEDSLPLLPRKTAEALLGIVEEQLRYTSSQKNGALVLGQIVQDGAPVTGAIVQVENRDDSRVVYLNEILIPDPELKETTSTGYFVMVHPQADYYSFRVEKDARFFGFGNLVVENGASSFVKIEKAKENAPFELRSFDAFTGEGLASHVLVQAADQVFNVDKYAMISHPISRTESFVRVEPADSQFMTSLFPYDGRADHLFMPLLRKAWLNELIGRSRINVEPGTGMVIGFTSKGGFEVSLPHLPEGSQVRVLYFDAQGLESPAPVDQGGFVLLNVPASPQTIVISDSLGQVLSEVMPVEDNALTTSRFDL